MRYLIICLFLMTACKDRTRERYEQERGKAQLLYKFASDARKGREYLRVDSTKLDKALPAMQDVWHMATDQINDFQRRGDSVQRIADSLQKLL